MADRKACRARSPANLYSNSTVAIDINTGKLNWYYQELPGDDWDADHNHERVLIRTRVSPDPRHVKWINPDIQRGAGARHRAHHRGRRRHVGARSADRPIPLGAAVPL